MLAHQSRSGTVAVGQLLSLKDAELEAQSLLTVVL